MTPEPPVRALRHPLVAGTALVAALTLSACAAQAGAESSNPTPRTITGTATGTVEGRPDTLTVTLGVDSGAPTAQAAMERNADRSTRVIGALKGAGVSDQDVQTTGLNVFPTFDNRGRPTGFRVANMVTARLHDLAGAGAVIDAAAAQAGDDIRVQGLAFSIEDSGTLMARARRDAVRRAHDQARQLATGAGVRLGAVRKVTERRSTPPSPFPFAAKDAARATTPIEPGSQEVTVDVAVVYEIRDR